MKRAYIRGTGAYLPERVMTNDDWAKLVDTSDQWITERSGIKERHFADPTQAASDLALIAAQNALKNAGVGASELDLVMVATISADHHYPSTANLVLAKLGISEIPSFDLGAACSGFLYGLNLGRSLIASGAAKNILLIGVEVMSRIINWQDRATCVLFGDGAGAVVLGATEEDKGILSSCWGSDGRLGELLIQPAGGTRLPPSHETVDRQLHTVHMKGNDVFRHAVIRMHEAATTALEQADLLPQDVDLFIPHQANIRIIEATVKRAGIPLEKTFVNIDKIANISSATIPIALDQAIHQGRIQPHAHVLLAAFGAGLTWAGAVVRF